jgi:small subunit ribosomal protein S15
MTKQELKKPTWLKYTKQEVEKIILKLTDQNLTAEKIGLVLRDQYGIPDVKLFDLKIKQVMKDKFEEPTNKNLNKKLPKIIQHYKKNKQDKKAERSLIITKAKLKKREDYQKKKSKN